VSFSHNFCTGLYHSISLQDNFNSNLLPGLFLWFWTP
jgi:hypothetical protein